MMSNIDQIITQLAQEAAPVRPMRAWRIFLQWLLAFTAYGLLVHGFILHPRPDLSEQVLQPLFTAEILTLSALFLSSLVFAAAQSLPGSANNRLIAALPIASAAAFVTVMFMAWLADQPPAPQPVHGWECLLCISITSLLPAWWLARHMRRMAPTRLSSAGLAVAAAAFALGAMLLRLSEDTNAIGHLIGWHYFPMTIFSWMGFALGQKIFRW